MSIPYQELCIAAIGTTTMAIKAQHILLGEGIVSEVQALSAHETRRGCAFGISFPCSMRPSVQRALAQARIPVSQFFKRTIPP